MLFLDLNRRLMAILHHTLRYDPRYPQNYFAALSPWLKPGACGGRSGQGCVQTTELEQVNIECEGHRYIINEFLDWLDGGRAPETVIDDNIQSTAMVLAAIQASEEKKSVDVQAKLRAAGVC